MLQRVQKVMADAGLASRRRCEELIESGRVTVNGSRAKLGDKADASKDVIRVDGKVVKAEKKVYLLFNKPKGCVTTLSDPYGRKTVMDFIRAKQRLFPVGRLDKDTEGLLLITNDGLLANRVMHPRYELTKTYYVVLAKPITHEHMRRLKRGVFVDRRKVAVARVKRVGPCSVEVDIHEGRKHIVRRIFAKLSLPVNRLVRTRIGPLSGRDIRPGKYKQLSKRSLRALRESVGLEVD